MLAKKSGCGSGLRVDDVASDLNDAAGLLRSQQSIGLDPTEVLASMFADISAKVKGIPTMSSREKQLLTVAIGEGPWDTEQKKYLATLVRGHATESAVLPGKRRNQRCLNVENWLDEKVWVYMKTPGHPRSAKSSVLATCMSKLGIELPCQRTLYRGVAILNFCEQIMDMDEGEVQKEMLKLQSFIKHHTRGAIPFFVDYPCSPTQLATELACVMFPKGLPVDVCIPELDGILQGARMRGRRSDTSASWLHHVPVDHRHLFVDRLARDEKRERTPRSPTCMSPCDIHQSASREYDVQLPLQHQRVVATLPWAVSPTMADKRLDTTACKMGTQIMDDENAKQTMAEAKPTMMPTGDDSSDDDDVGAGSLAPGQNSIHDMESRLLTASTRRNQAKPPPPAKVAAKAAAKAKAATKAKAAAKATATGVKKRFVRMRLFGKQPTTRLINAAPSGRPRGRPPMGGTPATTRGVHGTDIDMKDVFSSLRATFGATTRGAFVTKAFKHAQNRAARAGVPLHEQKPFARSQYIKAVALWNELSASS